VIGTSGNDVILDGTGADSLTGGPGDDTYLWNVDGGNDFIEVGRGEGRVDGAGGINALSFADPDRGWTVNLGTSTALGPGSYAIANVPQVIGSDFDDTLVAGATAVRPRHGARCGGHAGQQRQSDQRHRPHRRYRHRPSLPRQRHRQRGHGGDLRSVADALLPFGPSDIPQHRPFCRVSDLVTIVTSSFERLGRQLAPFWHEAGRGIGLSWRLPVSLPQLAWFLLS